MIKKICYTLSIYLILSSYGQAQHKVNIDWSLYNRLPSQVSDTTHLGLAGAYSGIIHNTLLLIGGANFPGKMPWDSGIKKYYQDIYILKLSDHKSDQWIHTTTTFPINIAYGASVVYRQKLICIGGENENGATDKIYEVDFNPIKNDIAIKELYQLPIPLTNLSATVIRDRLYIAGGENKEGVSNKLYSIDLNQIEKGFSTLKDIPVPTSHTVLLANATPSSSDIYLLGGRKKNSNGISTLYASVIKYNIKKNTWMAQADLPYPLSAHTGVTISKNQFLLIGGDKGDTFSKTEKLLAAIQAEQDVDKKQTLIHQKNQLQINHPGFSKDILHYNLKKNNWAVIGDYPFDPPVTTSAWVWNKSIILPSGEIKAGVRTPDIILGKIKLR